MWSSFILHKKFKSFHYLEINLVLACFITFFVLCLEVGKEGGARSFNILTDSKCRKYTGAQDITYACLSDLPSRLGPLERKLCNSRWYGSKSWLYHDCSNSLYLYASNRFHNIIKFCLKCTSLKSFFPLFSFSRFKF